MFTVPLASGAMYRMPLGCPIEALLLIAAVLFKVTLVLTNSSPQLNLTNSECCWPTRVLRQVTAWPFPVSFDPVRDAAAQRASMKTQLLEHTRRFGQEAQ